MKAKKVTVAAAVMKAFVKPSHAALAAHGIAEKHLKALGALVAKQWGSRKAFAEVRAQFTAECILTSPHYAEQRKIIKAPLGKKGTSEGDAIRDAKAGARSTIGMAWTLIANHAFEKTPEEKKATGETRGRPKTADHVKIAKLAAEIAKIVKGSDSRAFDHEGVMEGVQMITEALPRAVAEPKVAESKRRETKAPKTATAPKAPRKNKSTVPATVSMGKPKQKTRNVVGAARTIKAKAPRGTISARELVGAIG
jgi:hypothetical protein